MNAELSDLSVLLVDDDSDNLELIGYVLERAGCRVVTARTAAAALEALGKQPFGLVLSDIGLPDQDGVALMRAIRARGFDVPAVALTGYSGPESVQEMAEAGYQRHVAKPVDLAALLAVAKELGRRDAPA
jgi:two-component system CheB/CheR fusion protein